MASCALHDRFGTAFVVAFDSACPFADVAACAGNRNALQAFRPPPHPLTMAFAACGRGACHAVAVACVESWTVTLSIAPVHLAPLVAFASSTLANLDLASRSVGMVPCLDVHPRWLAIGRTAAVDLANPFHLEEHPTDLHWH